MAHLGNVLSTVQPTEWFVEFSLDLVRAAAADVSKADGQQTVLYEKIYNDFRPPIGKDLRHHVIRTERLTGDNHDRQSINRSRPECLYNYW
jgi:hypothetical protein